MPAFTPAERALIARMAAHESWARTANRTSRTAAGRDAFLRTFEDLVDPERVLSEGERERRAASARKAHFTRLALKSAQTRRAASARRSAVEELKEAVVLLAAVNDHTAAGADTAGGESL